MRKTKKSFVGGSLELITAAERGDLQKVTRLLDQGTNINKKDIHGNTALFLASMKGRLKIAELLLVNGANVNEECGDKMTALMAATIYNHEDTVQLLIDNGADVNKKNDDGQTALIIARELGNRDDIIKLLLPIDFSKELNVSKNPKNYLSWDNIKDKEELIDLPRGKNDYNSKHGDFLKYTTLNDIVTRFKFSHPITRYKYKRGNIRYYKAKISESEKRAQAAIKRRNEPEMEYKINSNSIKSNNNRSNIMKRALLTQRNRERRKRANAATRRQNEERRKN
jgi:hypothetical protein